MTLIYEHNGKHWSILFLMFLLKVFTGNTDRNIVVCRKLNKPIRARYVRVHPIAWHGHMSIRVELFGCNYTSCKAWLVLKWQDGKSLFVFALRNWMIDWLIDSLLWASTIVDFAFIECYVIKKKKKKDNINLCILAIRVFLPVYTCNSRLFQLSTFYLNSRTNYKPYCLKETALVKNLQKSCTIMTFFSFLFFVSKYVYCIIVIIIIVSLRTSAS